MRHETPREIAQFLAKYAPRKVVSVLDPAAGNGVLAEPFVRRVRKVQLLDNNLKAITYLESAFESVRSVSIMRANFLSWSSPGGQGYHYRFDCIVMNPPFAGKSINQVTLRTDSGLSSKVPLEVAFVYRAVHLLRDNGRLLAILPASVISGENTKWLREFLIDQGRVRLVHELPQHTFRGIEARIYIMIYEHRGIQGSLASRNHRLRSPDQLVIPKSVLARNLRFDFRFHEAHGWYLNLQTKPRLIWEQLGKIAHVSRGGISSPVANRGVLHTTNFLAPQKLLRKKRQSVTTSADTSAAQPGDILVKRVGRNCALSACLYTLRLPVRCSDCILIIRPKQRDALKVLFALRVLMAWSIGSALVENGIGAFYIPSEALKRLLIPVNLADVYPARFRRFTNALMRSDFRAVQRIEGVVRRVLGGTGKNEYESRKSVYD